MSRTHEFIRTFNEIESFLRNTIPSSSGESMPRLIDLAAERIPGFRNFSAKMNKFVTLRNLLVHGERGRGNIAEPTDLSVSDIGAILNVLTHPPRVYRFSRRRIIHTTPSSTIGDAVSMMTRHSFSQVPVLQDALCVNLLSANTISRWLGTHVDDDLVSLRDTRVSDVLTYRERNETFKFLGQNSTVFQAFELFDEAEEQGNMLAAILLTANGRPREALVGMVTSADVPRMNREIEGLQHRRR